jgi:hypothetical protein
VVETRRRCDLKLRLDGREGRKLTCDMHIQFVRCRTEIPLLLNAPVDDLGGSFSCALDELLNF